MRFTEGILDLVGALGWSSFDFKVSIKKRNNSFIISFDFFFTFVVTRLQNNRRELIYFSQNITISPFERRTNFDSKHSGRF